MGLLLAMLGRLPLGFLYFIGDVLWIPMSVVYRRRLVLDNLKKAFPDKTIQELKQIRSAFYKNLVAVIAEVIKIPSMDEAEIKRRVKCVNPEVMEEERMRGLPALLFAAHYCNWELLSLSISLHSGYRLDPIYKVQSNNFMDKFIYRVRSKLGGIPIPAKNALRNVLKNKEMRLVGIVGDQKPVYRAPKLWINFLGMETAFNVGGAAMAYMTQFSCYYVKMVRLKKGFYELEFVEIGKSPYEKGDQSMIAEFAREIEKQITSVSENWLWSHNRWKYGRRAEEKLYKGTSSN